MSEEKMTEQPPVAPWFLLTTLSLAAGGGWAAFVASGVGTDSQLPAATVIGVGNAIVAAFTASLMGLFAARKQRASMAWALAFGLPALVAGFIPLIIGAVIMAFVPRNKRSAGSLP